MSDEERQLIERMRDDAARNGDYVGAAELDALLDAEAVVVTVPVPAGAGGVDRATAVDLHADDWLDQIEAECERDRLTRPRVPCRDCDGRGWNAIPGDNGRLRSPTNCATCGGTGSWPPATWFGDYLRARCIATEDALAAAEQRADEWRDIAIEQRERIWLTLGGHDHADTCAVALSPSAEYPCSCWRAALSSRPVQPEGKRR